ncbi:5-dehydro-4-deoxyglucarate dehydratase [Nonomuraea sp. NPDC005501]|uniref:5-dehydro-4-deoxyglucarate dehydratase n=1 Tax=Nonomuraea sp. NPDC005501 TaxID=3156884 RepID=UPI0033BC5909
MTPDELSARLASGLLSFPVTHFKDDLSFDEAAYREHLAWLGRHQVGGLFAAGGTGEFFSLTQAEVERVVAVAVDAAPAGVPVLAPSGHGTATAVQLVRSAELAGAAGILLFPPYLTEADEEGLAAHVAAVCRATALGVIVYNRANARYSTATLERLAAEHPNFVGFKDGVGDLEQMTRVRARLGGRLLCIGGLPTAELYALPYHALGVETYSSAIFNFLPEFALAFHRAVRGGDTAAVTGMLNDFVLPYVELRDRRRGYAVSIVKAGLRAAGRPAGPVRPPLVDLTGEEQDRLSALIGRVSA